MPGMTVNCSLLSISDISWRCSQLLLRGLIFEEVGLIDAIMKTLRGGFGKLKGVEGIEAFLDWVLGLAWPYILESPLVYKVCNLTYYLIMSKKRS